MTTNNLIILLIVDYLHPSGKILEHNKKKEESRSSDGFAQHSFQRSARLDFHSICEKGPWISEETFSRAKPFLSTFVVQSFSYISLVSFARARHSHASDVDSNRISLLLRQ